MSQREYDAVMGVRMAAERLYESLTVEQLEVLAKNMHVMEAIAEGRIDVLDQFVPVRIQEDGFNDPTFPWGAEVQLRRYPVVIDSAVPWADRIPEDLVCESGRIFMTLRAYIASSRETLRLFRFRGEYASLEDVSRALSAARCRPATLHHLVAFAAAYRIGAHAKPGRIFATGNTEALPPADGGALLVPHILLHYDIDAEGVIERSLELERILTEQTSAICGNGNDYILAVENK